MALSREKGGMFHWISYSRLHFLSFFLGLLPSIQTIVYIEVLCGYEKICQCHLSCKMSIKYQNFFMGLLSSVLSYI